MAFPLQVRGFLIDLDGTVVEAQRLVPGVAQALAFFIRHVPYRLVTNTTSKPRSAILTKMRSLVWMFNLTSLSRRRSLGGNIFSSGALLVVIPC